MTRRTRDRDAILEHVREVIDRVEIDVERALVFGSVARDDRTATSDVDVLLVSSAFEGVPGAVRGRPFRDLWDYESHGAVDFFEYTPAEYRSHREREGSLVRTAEAEGIRIA